VNGSCKNGYGAPITLDGSKYLSRLCVEVIIGVTFHNCCDCISGCTKLYENIAQYCPIFENINSCADMKMYSGLSYNMCGIHICSYISKSFYIMI
jgi:hypothetical protein